MLLNICTYVHKPKHVKKERTKFGRCPSDRNNKQRDKGLEIRGESQRQYHIVYTKQYFKTTQRIYIRYNHKCTKTASDMTMFMKIMSHLCK